ncbi:helix-turn-helix domain-containing protein [Streptomyces polygonati]|uniref:Helix-turn-helix domain-containing protein n=1 Tax=Streptomyces polygonati TaxID=1617087 RepID=A0ABV8HL13_9ACTN
MTATTDMYLQPPIGHLLRQWRERRRLSQLDLSGLAKVSTRHLSFLETGRSKPSREMVVHLSGQLDIPLRDRNILLLAAGYAPVYPESPLDAPQMSAVRTAVSQILKGHDPYPAIMVDRNWDIVDANRSFSLFTEGVAPELLEPPINALRLTLHPDGMAPRITNLGEWRAHLMHRMRRKAARDDEAVALYEELRDYPCDQPEPELDMPGPGDIFVPLNLRQGDRTLSFFGMLATFGTALDITVAEMVIESFFPADPETVAALHGGLAHMPAESKE